MTFLRCAASYLSKMCHTAPIRVAAIACLACCVVAGAQTRHRRHEKPAAAIAPAPEPLPPQPVAPPPPPTPAELPAHPAGVTYADGLLSVKASNSSLDQILRDVSRATGMKITGGVQDERVFGNYGPASAAQVLSALLDGTSSNMMLVGSNGPAPAELVLTPRGGGPTPPNPNAARIQAEEDQQNNEEMLPKQSYRPHSPAPEAPATTAIPANPPESEPATPAPAADDAQPKSPNGVKTPQDIFNELQKMRQKQAQQQHTNQ